MIEWQKIYDKFFEFNQILKNQNQELNLKWINMREHQQSPEGVDTYLISTVMSN